KAGKLPKPAAAVSYSLEYGTATIEGPDVLDRGERVLLVDDILATGGTLTAAQSLVADLGAEVIGSAVVLELPELCGRRLTGDVHAVFAGLACAVRTEPVHWHGSYFTSSSSRTAKECSAVSVTLYARDSRP